MLDPGDWYSEVTVDPRAKTFRFYNHTPDYDGIFRATFEYRFEEANVFARMIEDSSEHYGKVEYNVKDNVVLESEIRQRHADKKISFKSVDEELSQYSAQVVWNKFSRHDVRFFIMSKHPEIFPPIEFRKLLRQELERLRSQKTKFFSSIESSGLIVHETEEGFQAHYPIDCPEEKKEQISKQFDEQINQSGVSKNEMYGFKGVEACLLKWLGEKPEAIKETA